MDILEEAREFLRVENEEFDSMPEYVDVGWHSEYGDEDVFDISGQFPEEFDEDDEDEGRILPPEERVQVSSGSEMFEFISEVFSFVRENVSVGEAEINSIHIAETAASEDVYDEWPFYTQETADARVFLGVEKEEVPQSLEVKLRELIVDELSKIDPSLSIDDLETVEYLYDDMDINFLQSVRGDLLTANPHRYYDGPESVEDYVSVVADNADEKKEMLSQDKYEVFYRLNMVSDETDGDGNTLPPSAVRERGEEVMKDFIDSTLSTEWETLVEAESISFGELDLGRNSQMSYWVNIPIVAGEIGVSQ